MKAISREKWIKLFVVETLVFIILVMSFSMTKQDKFSGVDIVGIISLLLFIPMSIYLFIKSIGRLKDVGMSGLWTLLILIPIIGWGSLLAILCLRGTEHKKGAVSRAMKIGSIGFGGITAIVAFLIFAMFITNTDQANTGDTSTQQKLPAKSEQNNNQNNNAIDNIENAKSSDSSENTTNKEAGDVIDVEGLKSPGIADSLLTKDAMRGVVMELAMKGCDKYDSHKSYILKDPVMETAKKGSWQERWIVSACGNKYQIDLNFTEVIGEGTTWTILK